jgi:hypothetical protein
MAGREDLAPKGSDVTSRNVSLEEINALFNITSGHDHDGTDSAKVSWNNILDKPNFNNMFYSLTMPSNEFNTADDGEGNLSVTWDNQTAGLVLAAPIGSTGAPSFRALVSSDIPALSYEPVLTKGNLTESTSSVLTISGGTGSVIGSGTTIQVKQASSTVSGYLSSTDWNTFNNKSDAHTHPYLSNSTTSTQNGYFGNINLYDDSTPSHYLSITNASNLTATRTLSIITGDADRSLTLSANVTLAHDTHALNADNQTITSGNGMNFTSGSGNVTVTLGTPGSITSTSTNSVTSTSHTHAITGFSLDGHTHSYAPNAFSTIAVSGQSNVVADSTADTLTFIAGTNVTLTTNATNDSVTINSVHPTITAATSVNNSGRTYIQDITVDANGHVTGLASATETDQNTFSNIHALNSSGTDVTNSPYTATTSTSSLNLKAGTGITLAMDTGGVITITGSTTYTHPTFTTRSISIDTSGVDVLDTLTFTSDANGHVTAASGTKRTLPSASTSVTGVLTSTDWNTFNGKMDATASTTAGYVPVWGANGKTLGTGYSVETTMTGSSSALVRADAVKTYIDEVIATADALVYKGVIDCSTNPNYPAGDKGHVYKVSVAGKIGGASGITVEAGDMVICNTDSTASGTQATVGSKWDIIQNNIDLSTLQPKDADLTAIAGLTGTGFAVRTASNTWANRSITNGTGISITNGDGISGNVTVAHTDTSTQATVTNTGRTYIQSITLDGMGHVTGLASATETVTDTNYYPTAFAWTGGTTSGPTGSLTGTGMSAVSFGAIPSASGTVSGVVTTGDQTFAGVKTFNNDIKINGSNVDRALVFDGNSGISAMWRILHAASGSGDTNYLTIQTTGASGSVYADVLRFGMETKDARFSGHVYPETTNAKTLGTSSLKWANIYATTFTGNLTGNVTGNVSGSSGSCTGNSATATLSSTVTTTEDTTNELILVGVTSGATTTLKRDTNVTVTNDSIKANNFKMGTSAYMTYNSSTECIEFIFN